MDYFRTLFCFVATSLEVLVVVKSFDVTLWCLFVFLLVKRFGANGGACHLRCLLLSRSTSCGACCLSGSTSLEVHKGSLLVLSCVVDCSSSQNTSFVDDHSFFYSRVFLSFYLFLPFDLC